MDENTWPAGYRHTIHQSDHENWNSTHYPGTRQMCCLCDQPTGRCEEDAMRVESIDGSLCVECYHTTREWIAESGEE